MQKLTAKKLIEFRNYSQVRKQSFANKLKTPPTKKTGIGGDYWIICTSAITNACKNNNTQIILDKIDYFQRILRTTSAKITKDMYQRNIDILSIYKSYDFAKLKPRKVVEFQTKPNTKSLLKIKGLEIEVFPSHVFSYINKDTQEVGAVWFIAQLNGYKQEELEIFSELLYRYLMANYSKAYKINPKFCIAVDLVNSNEVKYEKLLGSSSASILQSTIDNLKTYLK